MKHKIILDCDPGHDDAVALLLAAYHPEIELLAVTTVAGNQSVDKTTRISRGTQRWERHARCLANQGNSVKALQSALDTLLQTEEICDMLSLELSLRHFFPVARKSNDGAAPKAPRAIRRSKRGRISAEIETAFDANNY